MDRKMKLRDLLAYLENREAIQVGVADEDYWDNCTEIYAGSSLLTACHDWDITAMGAELSNDEDPIPIIRVMIKRPDQEAKA